MLATRGLQPVNIVKVRIQLGQGSAGHVMKTMLREDGIAAFYKGLSAGLLKQATSTTAPIAVRVSVGSRAELALIRMHANASLPLAQHRNYTKSFQALTHIAADEGVLALGKCAELTVVKARALNMGMLNLLIKASIFSKINLILVKRALLLRQVTLWDSLRQLALYAKFRRDRIQLRGRKGPVGFVSCFNVSFWNLTIYLVAILRRNLGPILPMTKRALMLGHQGPRLMDYQQGIVMSSPRPREGQGTLPSNAGQFSKEDFIWHRYAPWAIRDAPPLSDGQYN
ncbi:hypothetical protein GIB67_018517 [Kingdonia uniflora]|uniref:Uncharacterized protein n=1 Tax=Kingdonia uniflora TaxID=39325 RepID=A0A7J7LWC5_9MAGN|nr:hypothetical protein GIB67_018517 [Kingdonia uniflora]